MRTARPPPPVEPPPANAERADGRNASAVSTPTGQAVVKPVDLSGYLSKDHGISTLGETDGGASSPASQSSPPRASRRKSITIPDPSSPKRPSAQVSFETVTAASKEAARRVTENPPKLLNDLEAKLNHSNSQPSQANDRQRCRREFYAHLHVSHSCSTQHDKTVAAQAEHIRYLEEKVRHLEADNARLKQMTTLSSSDADKKRIQQLEAAVADAVRAERRALHLVVSAIGKDRMKTLLEDPKFADMSIEDRIVAAAAAVSRTNAKPSSSTSSATKPKPPATSPDKDAIMARSHELDLLWQQHCSNLNASTAFDRTLRRSK
ncbi:hypothetical protein Ae201684P_011037 [Aphanomyces euteiches]|nr:hypothetical protein Ae201684P_011037 [Aphanomyces euteiches]